MDRVNRAVAPDDAVTSVVIPERIPDVDQIEVVVAGYGTDVDRDLIRAWWSLRCLSNVRWLVEHGFGPPEQYPEVAVLRSPL